MEILFTLLVMTSVQIMMGYPSHLTCDLNQKCTDDKRNITCQLVDTEFDPDHIFDDIIWTAEPGPSEPNNLHVKSKQTADSSKIIITWSGPDDSSVRDLKGFEIQIEIIGVIFYDYIMDLRGNEALLTSKESMMLSYQLLCTLYNPFSQFASLDVVVTSLPKTVTDSHPDKSVKLSNSTIFIPQYVYSHPTKGVSFLDDRAKMMYTTTPSYSSSTRDSSLATVTIVTVSLVVVCITVGAVVFIRLKARRKRKRNISSSTENGSCLNNDDRSQETDNTPANTQTEHCIPYFKIETVHTTMNPCYPIIECDETPRRCLHGNPQYSERMVPFHQHERLARTSNSFKREGTTHASCSKEQSSVDDAFDYCIKLPPKEEINQKNENSKGLSESSQCSVFTEHDAGCQHIGNLGEHSSERRYHVERYKYPIVEEKSTGHESSHDLYDFGYFSKESCEVTLDNNQQQINKRDSNHTKHMVSNTETGQTRANKEDFIAPDSISECSSVDSVFLIQEMLRINGL